MLRSVHDSLLVNKGLEENKLALLMRFPHDKSEKNRISVSTR
jgi:hypothetical protein